MERKTISIMKACELVGVSRRTIYNWLSSGKIEYVRTAGGFIGTPHIGGGTREAALAMGRAAIEGLEGSPTSIDLTSNT